MSDSPAAARERIERARRALARAEGEVEAREKERAAALEKVRELLGCEPGSEKEALSALREGIEADEAEAADLLSRAEATEAPPQAP